MAGGHRGRGAWLCDGRRACFDEATGRGALDRALRARIDPRAVAALRVRLFGEEDHLSSGVPTRPAR